MTIECKHFGMLVLLVNFVVTIQFPSYLTFTWTLYAQLHIMCYWTQVYCLSLWTWSETWCSLTRFSPSTHPFKLAPLQYVFFCNALDLFKHHYYLLFLTEIKQFLFVKCLEFLISQFWMFRYQNMKYDCKNTESHTL